jgi:hypothetical protein
LPAALLLLDSADRVIGRLGAAPLETFDAPPQRQAARGLLTEEVYTASRFTNERRETMVFLEGDC